MVIRPVTVCSVHSWVNTVLEHGTLPVTVWTGGNGILQLTRLLYYLQLYGQDVHFFAYGRFYYFPNHHVVHVLFWHFPKSNYIMQAIASSKRSLWTILLSYSSSTSYRAARRYPLRRSRRIYVRVRTDPQSAQLWMPVAYGAVGPPPRPRPTGTYGRTNGSQYRLMPPPLYGGA